jgi:uncharacterized delta-60 repeat protein
MGPIIIIKSGTTSIDGDIVKGDFSYFSASTLDLGPTSITGLYSGIDAPDNGYTIYQIGGPNGLNARVATNTTELNAILITAGATGSTLNDRIIWATNTNSIFVNSGDTVTFYYFGGSFTLVNFVGANRAISLNTDGSNDTSFNIGNGFNNTVLSTAIQSDGKILVGGQFGTFTGATQNRLIRLNSDGSKDTSFNIGTGFNNDVYSIAIQSDGKVLVGGSFVSFTGSTQNFLIRLNSDGSKDTSFNIGNGFNNAVWSTAIQSDGKILVGGQFTTFTGSTQNFLIRLNSDGSKDSTFNIGNGFNSDVYSIAIQSDGKVLVGGNFVSFTGTTGNNRLIRLNSDGSKDTSFNIGTGFNFFVLSVAIQSDGKVLVGGNFTTFTGSTQNFLIRLNSDGSKDTSFNIGNGFNGTVWSTAIQSDGKILVGGQFTTFTGSTQNFLIRLNSDGSKDTSFNIGRGFGNTVRSVAIKSDGKILVGGQFTTFSGSTQNRLLKCGSNYSLDTSFNIGSGFNGTVNSTKIQSDGKVLAGGGFTTFTGATQNYLIRLNSDGSKDTSFNIGTGFGNYVTSVAIQSDGKVLVGGGFTTFTGATQNYLIRLNSDGSKDTSFNIGTGFNNEVSSIEIQSDGKVLAGGNFTTFTGSTQRKLIRLNSDGSKDTSFDIGTGFSGLDTVNSIAIQSDGKVLAGGLFTTYQGSTQNYLIRLNSDGSKDTSFNIGTGFNSIVSSIKIQSDGKVLAGGGFTTFTGTTQNRLIRLNSDGSKDTSFNIGTGFDNTVSSIAIQTDGKILVGGNFTTYQGVSSLRNILLNSDGSISNNSLTLSDQVRSVAIQQ